MPDKDVLLIYTTFPDKQVASTTARELVALKLAACANIFGGMTSIYEWRGELLEEREVAVLFKTRRNRFDEFSIELRKRHPYETPAIVGMDAPHVEVNYLHWLHVQTHMDKEKTGQSGE